MLELIASEQRAGMFRPCGKLDGAPTRLEDRGGRGHILALAIEQHPDLTALVLAPTHHIACGLCRGGVLWSKHRACVLVACRDLRGALDPECVLELCGEPVLGERGAADVSSAHHRVLAHDLIRWLNVRSSEIKPVPRSTAAMTIAPSVGTSPWPVQLINGAKHARLVSTVRDSSMNSGSPVAASSAWAMCLPCSRPAWRRGRRHR